jgi:hypothetical protein
VDEVSEARHVAAARLDAIRADMSAALGIAPAGRPTAGAGPERRRRRAGEEILARPPSC